MTTHDVQKSWSQYILYRCIYLSISIAFFFLDIVTTIERETRHHRRYRNILVVDSSLNREADFAAWQLMMTTCACAWRHEHDSEVVVGSILIDHRTLSYDYDEWHDCLWIWSIRNASISSSSWQWTTCDPLDCTPAINDVHTSRVVARTPQATSRRSVSWNEEEEEAHKKWCRIMRIITRYTHVYEYPLFFPSSRAI